MEQFSIGPMTVEAELRNPAATVQLARFHFDEPRDDFLHDRDSYWLDLCLTPRTRNARACYPAHWSPHRFERLGDVFAIPPGEAFHARTDAGKQTSLICQLRPELVRKWFEGDLEWTDRRLEASLDISSVSIRSLLYRLAAEARHPGFASDMLVELISVQIAIELGRYCESITDRRAVGGLSPWRLRLIDERLTELREAPTLGELASLCNLSVRQLTRGFRASRGCSIGDYAAQARIENAKRLLATEESVKGIAYSMGFSSPSSFAYAFRRATGSTPRQFRQRLRRVSH
jgi:AraC family transcriptional regulator